jgi:amino acid adenylation domain-containing protein
VPVEFVRELRALTQELSVPLIFDEVLTGFRVRQGGAQALYGVEADIATYGKVLGGGLPIGVVAGAADFLDVLDGGFWEFGDDSFPTTEMTFAGSTYGKHPLSMAVAEAVLNRLEREGPGFQEALNARTSELASRLNHVLGRADAPIWVENCGSLFRFLSSQKSDLFFYQMLERGIYIWEQRICFLSEAHTAEDLDRVVDATERSLAELRDAAFLPRAAGNVPPPDRKDSRDEPLEVELTETQRQIYFLSVLDERAAPAYHEAALLRITGDFDIECAREAVRHLVARHRGLRASVNRDGTHQRILRDVALEIPLTDLTDRSYLGREAAIQDCLEADAALPFDLTEPPPLRMRVIRLSPTEHLLFVVFHGIIVDGISLSVIVGELAALYTLLTQGLEPKLPEPAQLEDYVEWLRSLRESPAYEEAERYWLDHLSDRDLGCNLPADRRLVGPPTYSGGREHAWLDAGLLGRIRRLAAQQNATLFTTLVAGFCALLHRLTGDEELLIGMRVAVRDMEGADSLIANTVNLVPIVSSSAGNPRFSHFLETVRDTCFDALEHQIYPFPALIRGLNPKREAGRQPMGNVVINMDRSRSLVPPGGSGPTIHLIDYPIARGCLDLDVNLTDVDGSLRVDFEYSADLFDAATVQRWLDQYLRLLEAAAKDPTLELASLPPLTDAERSQLLVDWNQVEPVAAPKGDFLEAFRDQVERRPNAAAVSSGIGSLSYGDLDARASDFAQRLSDLGVGPETLVGIEMSRSADMLVAMLGTLLAGGAFVPLDPAWPAERRSYVLKDACVRVIASDRRGLCPDGATLVPVDAGGNAPVVSIPPSAPRASEVDPEGLAYLIYTSGSTGAPKAALLQRDGMWNHLLAKISALGLAEGDVVAQTAAHTFNVFIWQFLAPLAVGGRAHVIDDETVRDPRALVAELDRAGVSVFEAVPSLLRLLLEEVRGDTSGTCLSGLRWLVPTGEDLPVDLAREWLRLRPDVPLLNTYGSTESSDDVAHAVIREPPQAHELRTPVGRPIPGIQAYILDSCSTPVPVGAPGELFIGGIAVGRGYLNDPERTSRTFVPAPAPLGCNASRLYRTGDRARWRRDGSIEVLGRFDHQVKVRGFRVELSEIEVALRKHPEVRDAVAQVVADGRLQPQLVGYYEAESGTTLDPAELRHFVRGWLPDYMLPAFLIPLSSLPLTASGKIDRRALPAPTDMSLQGPVEYAAPTNATEELLASVWQDILRLEVVGIHDNFFELGGDSILSIQIVSRLRDQGVNIKPSLLFLHQTISELASALASNGEGSKPSAPESTPASPPFSRDFSVASLGEEELERLAQQLERAELAGDEGAIG